VMIGVVVLFSKQHEPARREPVHEDLRRDRGGGTNVPDCSRQRMIAPERALPLGERSRGEKDQGDGERSHDARSIVQGPRQPAGISMVGATMVPRPTSKQRDAVISVRIATIPVTVPVGSRRNASDALTGTRQPAWPGNVVR
jgi:hypothetical protein